MTTPRGRILLTLARNAIARTLGESEQAHADAGWLDIPGASFVTLLHAGELRGCIGSLEACRPLRIDVQSNARAAAFRDPRFPPVSTGEYPDLEIEVSLLSAAEEMRFESERDALAQLRPGTDGIVLEYGRLRSTFLPQVWEQLTEPPTFLAHLKQKAGLPAGFWADGIKLSRYSVEKWREGDLRENQETTK